MTKKIEINSTKERLIEVGMNIIREQGARNLSVRKVAEIAQVNLGSFVYHFGTRDAFVKELAQLWYNNLLNSLTFENKNDANPLVHLENIIKKVIDFIFDNKSIIAQLLLDLLHEEKGVIAFLRTVYSQHPQMILKAIQHAQQQNYIVEGDPHEIMVFIMSPIGLPIIFIQSYKKNIAIDGLSTQELENMLLNKQRALRCLAWSLKGISTK